jgi:hypothetical protein
LWIALSTRSERKDLTEVGSLLTLGGAVVITGAIAALKRIVIVWLALHGTRPKDRPAILRAVAALFAATRIDALGGRRETPGSGIRGESCDKPTGSDLRRVDPEA